MTQSRRKFVKSTVALGGLPLIPGNLLNQVYSNNMRNAFNNSFSNDKSIVGAYGPWLAGNLEDPPQLSWRKQEFTDLDAWREAAANKTRELIAVPRISEIPDVTVRSSYQYEDLTIEELEWKLPYGRPTEAVLLKPTNATAPLPGVLGLHDHSGQKYFGKRKIVRTSDQMHPMMQDLQQHTYSGKAWANELASRGYVVLVHDVFTFGSRRVLYDDIAGISWGPCSVENKDDNNPEDPENIRMYNEWAGHHEHILSKSLFCSGTTWPGVTLAEDQVALSILSSRVDVDSQNLGCCGLSGGGLRSDYLGGLDQRIKCAVSVGFMSTWKDFLLNKSYTHTWMTYAPLLPKFLDFPEIMGIRAPSPTMVLNNNQDSLYTLPEMQRSHQILTAVFEKAGAAERYQGRFYEGDHKFDDQMQEDAFDWFDRWLK